MSKNLSHLFHRQGLDNNLLDTINDRSNPSSLEENHKKAQQFLVGDATIYGTKSFYDFIEGDNAHKKAYVCEGSSCLCAGNQGKISQSLKNQFGADQVGQVNCLGRCHENRAFQIHGQNYSGHDIENLTGILEGSYNSHEKLQGYSDLNKSVLLNQIENLKDYYHVLDKMATTLSVDNILDEVIQSGLRGRGGAGFPTGIKWQSCLNAEGREKYIVCNADEGDPGAFSDRYLMEQQPHSLLFGMLTAAWICKANTAIIYIRDEYPESIAACEKAINEFNELSLDFLDNWDFKFKIIRGAGAYICGEETALLNSIEGQRPIVSVRPPFPTVSGLFNKPTVLNNVETFCAIHFILEQGALEYKSLGTEKSTGSKLVSLDASFNKPGVYEVEMGTPLERVVNNLGGGFSRPTKALHIGGPLGGLVPITQIEKLTLDFESFQKGGFLLGHASIIGVPESMPLIQYLRHLFAFTAEESCGKCFPCRLGATRGVEMFDQAISDQQKINPELLNDLLDTMEQGSLCALGGGVPLPIKNALTWFKDELSSYMAHKESTSEKIGVTNL